LSLTFSVFLSPSLFHLLYQFPPYFAPTTYLVFISSSAAENMIFFFFLLLISCVQACSDDPNYIDPGGYECVAWQAYDCVTEAQENGITTPAQKQALLTSCPFSCGLCSEDDLSWIIGCSVAGGVVFLFVLYCMFKNKCRVPWKNNLTIADDDSAEGGERITYDEDDLFNQDANPPMEIHRGSRQSRNNRYESEDSSDEDSDMSDL
tara:strand:- start:221 stop:838 length:618 start_codon:yes stop_codon:yes gene_type:complete